MSSETELATGRDFVEANHGLKPAPTESTPAEPEQYGGGFEELKRAANDHTAERGSSEAEPVERFLEWKSGSKAGQRVDLAKEGFSLTPETAAKTLSEVHRTEDAIEANANLSELQREVDLARHQVAAAQQPPDAQQSAQAETPQPIDSPQPESGEQPSTGIDPDFAALLEKKPQLRAQLEAPFQQAEAARQAFTGATAQVAGMLVAELCADLPEIASLPPEQRLVGLQILQKQQPERYAAVEAKAARIQQVVNAQQQNNAYEAHQRQEQYKQWAKSQDAALEAKIPELATDTEMKASKAALRSLKDVGYSEEELAAAWNGQPFSMRDHRAQLLIWKAAQYDMARANAHTNPASRANIPPVQRPGIAPSAGERSAVDLSGLRAQLKNATGLEAVRIATKLHQAQRRARG